MPSHRCPRLPASKFQRNHRARRTALLAATAISIIGCSGARAADGGTNEALMKKLEKMEKRIEMLEAELKEKQASPSGKQASPADKGSKPAAAPASAKNANAAVPSDQPKDAPDKPASKPKPLDAATPAPDKPILGLADSPVAGLSIGAYGEIKFGTMQNPAAGGQWQNGFDAARFDLLPFGYINQHHEPTQFYSVGRPELYNGIIPSTWKVPSTSVYGTITEDLKYQVMVSTSNEDFGDSFDNRTGAKTAPPPGTAYVAGIDGVNALG